jgi:hypothetical protein
MASIQQLLEALNTKAATVSSSELAKELGATTETTLTQLKREKEKGNVDGNVKEGWLITDEGRKALEKGVHPTMIDEGVTPRQQFEAIGQRIGIPGDRIILAADIVWSGDYTDIKWVWEALGQANLAADVKSLWVNAWRAKLQKAIPPELLTELTGAAKLAAGEGETGVTRTKVPDRDYIIAEDIPVRVGAGLGDYTMQDAKDILAIRALKNRLGSAGQAGGTQPAAMEKVSDIITALEPYINKGADLAALKETLADKLALVRQEILSHIPQPGQTIQPRSFIEQLTDFIGVMSQMKNAGPMLKSILGIPETSANPLTGTPVQVTGPGGQPVVMDLGSIINWKKFEGEERRADERHTALVGLAQTVRENVSDGVAAIKAAVEEAKKGTEAKAPAPQPTAYECGACHTKFSIPDVPFETVKCPNPQCGRVYTKEEVMSV